MLEGTVHRSTLKVVTGFNVVADWWIWSSHKYVFLTNYSSRLEGPLGPTLTQDLDNWTVVPPMRTVNAICSTKQSVCMSVWLSSGIWRGDTHIYLLTIALCATDKSESRSPWHSAKPSLFFSPLFSFLAFISSWEEEMTHNLEDLRLANHSTKHLKIHTDTFPFWKENLLSAREGWSWISVQFLRILANYQKTT